MRSVCTSYVYSVNVCECVVLLTFASEPHRCTHWLHAAARRGYARFSAASGCEVPGYRRPVVYTDGSGKRQCDVVDRLQTVRTWSTVDGAGRRRRRVFDQLRITENQ